MFILKRKYLIIPKIFTKIIQLSKYTIKLYILPSLWLTEYSISKGRVGGSQTKIYSVCKLQKSLKRLRAASPIKKKNHNLWSDLWIQICLQICISMVEEEPWTTLQGQTVISPLKYLWKFTQLIVCCRKDNIQKCYYCRPLNLTWHRYLIPQSDSRLHSLTLFKVKG